MGKAKEEMPTMGTGVLQVESVQELAQKDLLEVPERYIRESEERPNDTNVISSLETPVIDLSLLSCGNEEELKKLETACREWGFFQVGHVNKSNSQMPGYYDGRYWTMWKLPMFACSETQVLTEIKECKMASLTMFGFDSKRCAGTCPFKS